MELLKKRLANLLCVKSILTLILTVVFAHQVIVGNVGEDFFRTIFVMIVTFYFSAQAEKKEEQAPHG